MSRARIFAKTGPFAGSSFELGAEATLGRDGTNPIVLADRRISARHCRIHFDPETAAYRIEDLGSSNGTFIDGLPVRGVEPLPPLAILNLGGAGDLIFQQRSAAVGQPAVAVKPPPSGTIIGREAPVPPPIFGPPSRQGSPSGTIIGHEVPPPPPALVSAAPKGSPSGTIVGHDLPALPPRLDAEPEPELRTQFATEAPALPPPVAPPRVFRLVIHLGAGWDESFVLNEGAQELGRSQDCRFSLVHQALSRRHARLRLADGRIWVTDLESTNGTFLGDDRLPAGEEIEIAPGRELRFGALVAEIVEGEIDPEPRIRR